MKIVEPLLIIEKNKKKNYYFSLKITSNFYLIFDEYYKK